MRKNTTTADGANGDLQVASLCTSNELFFMVGEGRLTNDEENSPLILEAKQEASLSRRKVDFSDTLQDNANTYQI